MALDKKVYSHGEQLRCLMNIPKILAKCPELMIELEERYAFDGECTPSEMLKNWRSNNNIERMTFLGWFKGGVDKLPFKGIGHISLNSKWEFEGALKAILENATEEERRAYEKAKTGLKCAKTKNND